MALLFKGKLQRRDYTKTKVKLDIIKTWTQSTFIGNIQPASARTLALLPQGSFSVGAISVYSEDKLKVKQEGAPSDTGTFVFFTDMWYELTAEMPWKAGGLFKTLDHYKYVANPRTNPEVGL